MARPTTLTPELQSELCLRLSQVGSLRRVCRDHDMPTDNRVREWVAAHPEFAEAYARAKEAGIHSLVEEALDIIDEPPPVTNFGSTDSGHVSWAKERAGYRRWLAERMMPKVYGVKSGLDLTNSDGKLTPVDETTRAARVATLLATAQKRQADAQSADDIC